MLSDLSQRLWFDSNQAALYANCHRQTIVKALQSGDLAGGQRKAKGRWRIHRDALDAWLRGESA